MKIFDIPEPDLEFGAGRHIDIRFGIANYAPLDFESPLAPKDLILGVVGSEETIEGVSEWLQRVRDGVPAKESNQPNLFTNFPGCTPDLGFRTRVTIDKLLSHSIRRATSRI